MKHKKWLILSVLMVAFIFSNSLMPADVSSEQSAGVTRLLENVILFLFNQQLDLSNVTIMIRKSAHFIEFALLGFLVMLAFLEHKLRLHQALYLALIICMGIAIVDESIQYFVPGRAMSVLDMIIDTSGATLGIFLVYSTRREKEGEL